MIWPLFPGGHVRTHVWLYQQVLVWLIPILSGTVPALPVNYVWGGGRIPMGDFWHAWLRRIAIMRSAGLPPMKSHIDLSWENAKEQRVVCQRAVAGRGWHLRHAGISRCEHAVLRAKGCTQNQTKTRTCVVMTHINLSIFQVTSL